MNPKQAAFGGGTRGAKRYANARERQKAATARAKALRDEPTDFELQLLDRLAEQGRSAAENLRRDGETPQAVGRALMEMARHGAVRKIVGRPTEWELK